MYLDKDKCNSFNQKEITPEMTEKANKKLQKIIADRKKQAAEVWSAPQKLDTTFEVYFSDLPSLLFLSQKDVVKML